MENHPTGLTFPKAFYVVVTRKKISSKKAISAIEPALISGTSLLAITLRFY